MALTCLFDVADHLVQGTRALGRGEVALLQLRKGEVEASAESPSGAKL